MNKLYIKLPNWFGSLPSYGIFGWIPQRKRSHDNNIKNGERNTEK